MTKRDGPERRPHVDDLDDPTGEIANGPAPADGARYFDEPGSRWGERRSGRDGRSIPHSYGGEGFNHVD